MTTYIVFTKESTQDQAELDIYQSKVGPTFEGHPVKILAAYGPQQVLEGEAPEGVVIVEFPSTAAARQSRAERRRASTRRSSCATATRSASAAKASSRPSTT